MAYSYAFRHAILESFRFCRTQGERMSISYFFMQNVDVNIIYCNLFDTQGTPLRCSNHEHRRVVRAPPSFEQFAPFEVRRSSGHLRFVPFRSPISRPFNHKIAFHMHIAICKRSVPVLVSHRNHLWLAAWSVSV